MVERHPFSPAEFDAAKRELERRHPQCWHTSGYRSATHNAAVRASPESKHAMIPCMAADYGALTHHELRSMADTAIELGLWYKIHTVGGPDEIHLHVQGLPIGPIAQWWQDRYLEG